MTLNNHIHQVLYHMGQSISRDSDVIKSSISKTPPTHKTATIVGTPTIDIVGYYSMDNDQYTSVAMTYI